MTERLRRAIARKEFFSDGKWSRPSRLSNAFGKPIGKPLCIRSVRRYLRIVRRHNLRAAGKDFFTHDFVRGMSGKSHLQDVSSKRVARTVRYLKREGKYAV